jgi:hypothetical protein
MKTLGLYMIFGALLFAIYSVVANDATCGEARHAKVKAWLDYRPEPAPSMQHLKPEADAAAP